MAYINPIINKKIRPTKEDLAEMMGPGRYRRFDAVYEELIGMDIGAAVVWDKIQEQWYYQFRSAGVDLFQIRWGLDFFYGDFTLAPNQYTNLLRHSEVTKDVKGLLQANPVKSSRNSSHIELNLEKISDQEVFFELLELQLKVML